MSRESGRSGYVLKFISGKYQGGEFPLEMNQELLIGRSSDLDMVLVEDMVSRHHATISCFDNEIWVEDVGSTNGTFVNGARIDMVILREGDRAQVGPEATLQFVYKTREALRPKTEDIRLSKRELEVAQLVAQGLTSQEVATELGISPRAVTTHLSKIYERLGLPGRAALARYVVQRGLA